MTYEKFLNSLDIYPKKLSLFYEAITHPSYKGENNYDASYQRLEFLGDSVIARYAAEYIYKLLPKADEGQLTLLRSAVVNGKALAIHTKKIGLNKFIRVASNAKNLVDNPSINEDIFEAFIGAILLDQGHEKVYEILDKTILVDIKRKATQNVKNPKTILQEFLQGEERQSVTYITKKIDNGFKSSAISNGVTFGTGIGKTKKESEVEAAKEALRKVGE